MSQKRAAASVREPLQVYITGDERRLLDRLSRETGLSRAEVLRRGLKSFAREQPSTSAPLVEFMKDMRGDDWPADLGRHHDKHLDEAHLATNADRRKGRPASKKRR